MAVLSMKDSIYIKPPQNTKLIHSDSKQISGCLGIGASGEERGMDYKVSKENLKGDGYVCNFDCGYGFMLYSYIKTYQLYT